MKKLLKKLNIDSICRLSIIVLLIIFCTTKYFNEKNFYTENICLVRETPEISSSPVYVLKPSQAFNIKGYINNWYYIDVNGKVGFINNSVINEKTSYNNTFNIEETDLTDSYLISLKNSIFAALSKTDIEKFYIPELSEEELDNLLSYINNSHFCFMDYKLKVIKDENMKYIDMIEFKEKYAESIMINNKYNQFLYNIYDYQTNYEKIINLFNNIKNSAVDSPGNVFEKCLNKLNIEYEKEDALYEFSINKKQYLVSFEENILLKEKTL